MKTYRSPLDSADTIASLVASNYGKKSAKLAKKIIKHYLKGCKGPERSSLAINFSIVEEMLGG